MYLSWRRIWYISPTYEFQVTSNFLSVIKERLDVKGVCVSAHLNLKKQSTDSALVSLIKQNTHTHKVLDPTLLTPQLWDHELGRPPPSTIPLLNYNTSIWILKNPSWHIFRLSNLTVLRIAGPNTGRSQQQVGLILHTNAAIKILGRSNEISY